MGHNNHTFELRFYCVFTEFWPAFNSAGSILAGLHRMIWQIRRFSLSSVVSSANLAVAMCLFAGCGSEPDRIPKPGLDPSGSAARAMQMYDKNGDGKLSATELSPGLKCIVEKSDTDHDGALSKDEIEARLATHEEVELGLQSLGGQVWLDGKPLIGAAIKLIPDPMLTTIKPASGVSNDQGFVDLVIQDSNPPGVHPGIYRVEVSKQGSNGEELLPAKFNTRSELGVEVGLNNSQAQFALDLKR